MSTDSAHRSYWQTSDAIISGAIILALGIHLWKYPIYVTKAFVAIRIAFGVCSIISGILLIVLAKLAFKSSSQPSAPKKPTTAIVQNGIFRYSRNPVYLGLVLIYFGFGFAFNILWFIFFTLPLALAFQSILIIPEEIYLKGKFGQIYTNYMARVPRWL